ncbi:MAG: sortase, partial [Chloroflexi bacterium]|nr:sortase [Chloroflexota bacterium]
PAGTRVATRVVVPALGIDLPVIKPPGGPNTYPVCNVAMYIQSLSQPGQKGATYLYAHARAGMFLPILEASRVSNGRAMIGMLVQVYTSDNMQYLYEIYQVRRHQLSLNDAISAKSETLWLQTSEGPRGTPGKTQVVARPISSGPADPNEARPTANPVVCG